LSSAVAQLGLVKSMKRVVPVPVAIGIAAGVVVGFCLGAMVTRHGEPAVVIRNATDATLHNINITTDAGGSYCIPELQPHNTSSVRMSSHRPIALNVSATTAEGKQLSSDKVYLASQGVVFALVSSDGITLQYER
jgi:ribose/xylose/arabinose/galactoside ABC-type transport system permease subunit